MYTVDGSVEKTDSMRMGLGDGGAGMNVKHSARILGPVSVRLRRAAMRMRWRIECPVRECMMH
jgi:hypothetical protein